MKLYVFKIVLVGMSPVSRDLMRRELALDVDDLAAESVPQLPEPVHLRPCCAFGSEIKVSLGAVPAMFLYMSG